MLLTAGDSATSELFSSSRPPAILESQRTVGLHDRAKGILNLAWMLGRRGTGVQVALLPG
jgi:hypothetical protein